MKLILETMTTKDIVEYLDVLKSKAIDIEELSDYINNIKAAIKLAIKKDKIVELLKEAESADDFNRLVYEVADPEAYSQMYDMTEGKKKKNKIFINTNAGDPVANQAFFNAATTTGNPVAESISERKIDSLDAFIQQIDYNGPEYRGARIPTARRDKINAIRIPDNMRLKWFDVNIDYDEDNYFDLDYTTQEEFSDEDFEVFAEEVERALNWIYSKSEIKDPITCHLTATCRDGEEYGYGETTITIK